MEDFKPATNEVANDSEYADKPNVNQHQEHGHSNHHNNNHHFNQNHHQEPVAPISPDPVLAPAPVAQPIIAVPQPQPTWTPEAPKKKGFFKKSFAYLPEYLVMLLTLMATVSAIVTLIGTGIDSLVKSEKAGTTSSYASAYSENFNSFELVASLSTLAVALPIFIILFIRTKSIEQETPGVRNHRWRKGFLGSFLAIEGITVICTLISVAYDLIGRAIDSDNGVFSLFSGGAKDPWWQVVLTGLLSVAILLYVIYVVSRDYKQAQEA